MYEDKTMNLKREVKRKKEKKNVKEKNAVSIQIHENINVFIKT